MNYIPKYSFIEKPFTLIPFCIWCDHELFFDPYLNPNLSICYDYQKYDFKKRCITISKSGSSLTIDNETYQIIDYNKFINKYNSYYGPFCGLQNWQPSYFEDGFSITMGCIHCNNFEYSTWNELSFDQDHILQVDTALSQIRLMYQKKLFLNFDYLNNQTVFQKEGGKVESLPLIDLDLKNPLQTIERVEKLIIFS